MTITLQLPKQDTKVGWEGSPLLPLQQTNNQHKGSFGTYVVKQVLEQNGVTCKVISDRGDLETSKGRSEVKCAFSSHTGAGFQLWWNQVRPQQDGWQLLHLVGFTPDSIMVWELTREQFLSLGDVFVKNGHVSGEEDGSLKEVKVRKNSKTDTVALLNCYLIATIPADEVSII